MQSLQQQAGNSAVAALMGGGRAATGVQRAPKLGAGDQLMSPDGDEVPLHAAGTATATGTKATATAAPGPAGPTGDSQVFERSLLDPLRALYACVRDVPPDYELALQHITSIGQTLNDYWNRYSESDPANAEGFMSALGWLSRVRDVVLRRVGEGKEMSDAAVASNVVAVMNGLKELQGRIH
jgi:hypothetical protein